MKTIIFLIQSFMQERQSWVILGGFVGVLLVGAATWVVLSQPAETVVDTITEAPVEASTDTQGYIYFSALAAGEADSKIDTYAYDIATGVVRQLTYSGFSVEYAPVDTSHALLVTLSPEEEATGGDFIVPVWFDFENEVFNLLRGIPAGWNEVDLAASPDGVHVALAQQAVEVTDASVDDLTNWQVVIANPEQETNVVLEAAAMPIWIDGGDNLLYIKSDGIYLYNMETGLTGLMYDGYLNLSAAVELAASPDSQHLVMTLPDLNQLSLLRFTNSDTVYLEEVEVLQTPGMVYRSPVFAPDAQSYAVMTFPEVGERVPTVEIREVGEAQPKTTFTLPMFPMSFFKLNAWEDYFIGDASEHGHSH